MKILFILLLGQSFAHSVLAQAIKMISCNKIPAFIIDSDVNGTNFRLKPSAGKDSQILKVIPYEYTLDTESKKIRNNYEHRAEVTIQSVYQTTTNTNWFLSKLVFVNLGNDGTTLWGPQTGYLASSYKLKGKVVSILGSILEPIYSHSDKYWYTSATDQKKINKIPNYYYQKSAVIPIHSCEGDRIKTTIEVLNSKNKLVPTDVWIDQSSLCPSLETSCS